jgi:hypothetical protein
MIANVCMKLYSIDSSLRYYDKRNEKVLIKIEYFSTKINKQEM